MADLSRGGGFDLKTEFLEKRTAAGVDETSPIINTHTTRLCSDLTRLAPPLPRALASLARAGAPRRAVITRDGDNG